MTARGRAATLAALALAVLVSCATVPVRAPSEWLGALPKDATLYASFSVTGSAALVKKALAEAGPGVQDVNTLLDMTRRLVCSVTVTPGAPARFSVLALGNYPSGIISLRLSGSKDWTSVATPAGRHFLWNKAGIQMSIPNNGILLASNGAIDGLLFAWASPAVLAVPPEVASDMQSADLVLYMPTLPGGLAQSAAEKGVRIPINEVWLNAVRGADGYEVSGTANTGSEQDAKLLTLVLKLGIVAWLRSENVPDVSVLLKGISVSASGVQVKMTGLRLSDSQIIPMFLSLVNGLEPSAAAPSTTEASPGPDSAP